MNFRLPSKYALLIINVLVLLYFFLYFYFLGLEYTSQDGDIKIVFNGLNFSNDYKVDIKLDKIVVPFGQAWNTLNSLDPSNPDLKMASKMDVLIIAMLSIQSTLTFLSLINLFIWKGFKKARTLDILSKLMILAFVALAISWMIFSQGLIILKSDRFLTTDGYKVWIYIIGQIIMPVIFMFVHIWMTAPLYKKQK